MATSSALPITHVCAIHALVAAYVNLMSQLTAIPALCQHVEAVIDARRKHAPFYLPIMAFNRSNTATRYTFLSISCKGKVFNEVYTDDMR